MVARVNLAVQLIRMGREENMPEALTQLTWGYRTAIQRGYVEAEQIADMFRQLGMPPPEDVSRGGLHAALPPPAVDPRRICSRGTCTSYRRSSYQLSRALSYARVSEGKLVSGSGVWNRMHGNSQGHPKCRP